MLVIRCFFISLITLLVTISSYAGFQDSFLENLEGHWSGESSTVPSNIELILKKKLVKDLPGFWVLEGVYKKEFEAPEPLVFDITIAKLSVPFADSPLYVMKLINRKNNEARRYSLVQEITQDNDRALFLTSDGEYYQQANVLFGSTTEFRFENEELVFSVLDSKSYCKNGLDLEYCSDGKGVIYRLTKVIK